MSDAASDEAAAGPQNLESAPPPPLPDIILELSLPADEAGRLWRSRALTPLRAGRTRRAKLRMTWHDTPDSDLAKAGVALVHVEEPARDAWQTQRLVRDGALIWPLGTPAPLVDPSGSTPADPPPPWASLTATRRSLALAADLGLSEITLVEGPLAVGATTVPVARLTLRGAPMAVCDLARALLDDVKLTVAETGLSGIARHRLGETAAPKPPVLNENLTIDDAFAHVVSELAATIAYHAPAAREGRAVEPVHQMRVALRRLRSALSLFRKLTDGPQLDRARQDLAGLARALGPARDWDVFLGGTGRDIARLLPDEPAVARLMAAARRRRGLAYAELAQLLDSPAFQRLLLDLIELAVARPWRTGVDQDRPALVAFASRALDRKLRQVVEAGEDLSPLPIEALHAARIRCKRLRYAAELFVPLAPGKHSRRFLRRLAAVQERLGQLNDGAVAAGLLAELGARGFAAGVVHGYLAARTAGSRAKAARSWRKFRRADPFWK